MVLVVMLYNGWNIAEIEAEWLLYILVIENILKQVLCPADLQHLLLQNKVRVSVKSWNEFLWVYCHSFLWCGIRIKTFYIWGEISSGRVTIHEKYMVQIYCPSPCAYSGKSGSLLNSFDAAIFMGMAHALSQSTVANSTSLYSLCLAGLVLYWCMSVQLYCHHSVVIKNYRKDIQYFFAMIFRVFPQTK